MNQNTRQKNRSLGDLKCKWDVSEYLSLWDKFDQQYWGVIREARPGNGDGCVQSRGIYSHRFSSCELATSIGSQYFTCNAENPKTLTLKTWTLKNFVVKI